MEIAVRVFITASRPSGDMAAGCREKENIEMKPDEAEARTESDDSTTDTSLDVSGLHVHQGRPNVKEIIKEEITRAGGDVSVNG